MRKWEGGKKREHTRSLRFRDGGDEGHEAGAAEELSDEDSSVTLSFGGVNPLQTRAKNTGFAAALTKNTATVATHGCEMEMGCGMEKKEAIEKNGRWEQSGEEGKRGIYKRGRGEINCG